MNGQVLPMEVATDASGEGSGRPFPVRPCGRILRSPGGIRLVFGMHPQGREKWAIAVLTERQTTAFPAGFAWFAVVLERFLHVFLRPVRQGVMPGGAR